MSTWDKFRELDVQSKSTNENSRQVQGSRMKFILAFTMCLEITYMSMYAKSLYTPIDA